ncbi:MAG: prepilin peptidase [Phycisphaerales bacterium]
MPNPPYLVSLWQIPAVYVPFAFAFGAIVGSFLNVVILRLPAGENLISPPSRCPKCGRRLRWHENLPVLGWLRLGGKCAGCRAPISVQYPLIEFVTGLFFAACFTLFYIVHWNAPVLGAVAPDWLPRLGVNETWPIYLLYVLVFSALLAMTVIDLRTYTIPIEITWAVTVPAILGHTLYAWWASGGTIRLPLSPAPNGGLQLAEWALPLVGPGVFGAAVGGMLGVIGGWIMLRANWLRYSFLDFDLYVGAEDQIIDYPHPRRELEWEIDYLAPVLLGLVVGGHLGGQWAGATLPLWAAALGGSLAGYLVGAGLVWGIRILGTVAFGKEAMGLGDAHLLGCVGAALGWIDPILIFFLAPFLAILWVLFAAVFSRILGKPQRYIPYGPWLAAATIVVMFGDGFLEPFLGALIRLPINLP